MDWAIHSKPRPLQYLTIPVQPCSLPNTVFRNERKLHPLIGCIARGVRVEIPGPSLWSTRGVWRYLGIFLPARGLQPPTNLQLLRLRCLRFYDRPKSAVTHFKTWASLHLSSSLCACCPTDRPSLLVLPAFSHSLRLLSYSTFSTSSYSKTPMSLLSFSTGCLSLEAPFPTELILTSSFSVADKRYIEGLRPIDSQRHADLNRSMATSLRSYSSGRRRLYAWG